MSIGFKDFIPDVTKSGLLFTDFEALPETVTRANQWIAATQVQVINIETVVLPSTDEVEEASRARVLTSSSCYWHQIVRVWYRLA